MVTEGISCNSGYGVKPHAAKEKSYACCHYALPDISLGKCCDQCDGAEAQGEIFPWTEKKGQICDNRCDYCGDKNRTYSGKEGCGHTYSEGFGGFSFECHGIAVKAGCYGGA